MDAHLSLHHESHVDSMLEFTMRATLAQLLSGHGLKRGYGQSFFCYGIMLRALDPSTDVTL